MSKYTTKKKVCTQERSTEESILLLFPLILAVTLLPLIVKMHTYHTNLSSFDWYTVTDEAADFFLFYKQWFFVGLSCLATAIIGIRAFWNKKTLKYEKSLLPLFLYALLALLSTLFSKYRSFGFSGIFEQFENIFCILGYVLMVYYAYVIIETEKELTIMIRFVAIGALVMGIIGTLQAFGLDPLNTVAFKSSMAEQGVDINSLTMAFENGRAYGTLYNPNYLGVYASFMIPIFTVMFFFAKNVWDYLLYGSVVITSIISLVGSQSKAGFISVVFGLFFALIMLRKYLIKKWKVIIPVITVLVITFIVINKMNNNVYLTSIKNAFQLTKNETPDLSSINTQSDGVEITYKGNTFKISLDDTRSLMITEGEDTSLTYDYIASGDGYDMYLINDARFTDIVPFVYTGSEYVDKHFDFGFNYNNESYHFSKTYNQNEYMFFNRYGRFSPFKTAESALFTGYESFASRRGYIWSRTIPLLKNHILLGTGADTFITAFPQYDYIGLSTNWFQSELISKPHSLYLQIGVQSGVVSLISFFIFFIIYLVQSIHLYFRTLYTTLSAKIGLAICTGVISYLISGISNDSNISVAPVFWCIVGIGFTSNLLFYKAKNKK